MFVRRCFWFPQITQNAQNYVAVFVRRRFDFTEASQGSASKRKLQNSPPRRMFECSSVQVRIYSFVLFLIDASTISHISFGIIFPTQVNSPPFCIHSPPSMVITSPLI
jgi:hypothetical protein